MTVMLHQTPMVTLTKMMMIKFQKGKTEKEGLVREDPIIIDLRDTETLGTTLKDTRTQELTRKMRLIDITILGYHTILRAKFTGALEALRVTTSTESTGRIDQREDMISNLTSWREKSTMKHEKSEPTVLIKKDTKVNMLEDNQNFTEDQT